ncbi:hypothetical protein BGV72_07345 [Burkholderia ubonensis]|nr:hypothetical protein BGV72_07345 [Burkholderia ubonensis]
MARGSRLPVIDPCTERPFAEIATGDARDVDRAVEAAKRAFVSFSQTTPAERVALVRRTLEMYLVRYDEIAATISREIGAPRALAHEWQAGIGRRHLEELLKTCASFVWERDKGTTRVRYEPVGLVALITLWNWPISQIVCKVA